MSCHSFGLFYPIPNFCNIVWNQMRNKTYIETINGAFFAETRPKNSDRTNRFGRCQSNKREKERTRTRFRCWKPAIVYNRARIIQLSQFYFIYWFRLWKFMAMCVQCSLLTVQCFSPMSNVLWNSNVSTILTLTFFLLPVIYIANHHTFYQIKNYDYLFTGMTSFLALHRCGNWLSYLLKCVAPHWDLCK